ncbi:GNAT family N-acetyltransferase [Psychrobacillus sp. OK032]|uniref:GNAT family N-acetyltransferase n=1 Tax=Psychrobacillus sp. OK032 TaxID=1884358 RepID=UPI0008BF4069|nr:GNAT family N-acetyltransferase [Psychrobacillus sp. OK032]SES36842.1 Acetyltransferase (GNAT) domain-containing protein [Psychrobacillus sp. OK032]
MELVVYDEKYRTALEDYPLSEEHLTYTAHPLELLERRVRMSTYTPVVILENEQVAGFFVLDTGDDKFHYTDQPDSILLRGYSIHPAYQGRGIAKSSMALIPSYIKEHFPQVNQVVLGVNEANKAAQSLYIKAGFIDEGKRFTGRSGVQIAMCLKLKEIIIRQAIPGDEQGIVDICVTAQWNTYKELYTTEYIERIIEKYYTTARIQDEIISTSREWNGYYVAVLNDQIVGAIGGGVDEEGVAEIYVLYLDPVKRGQGIGTKLLNYFTEIQRIQYKAKEQWVSAAKGNDLGIPFYEARGFIFQMEEQAYESTGDDNISSLRYHRMIKSPC